VTERKEKPVSMNAFELISRSQSFNLENLFEKQTVSKDWYSFIMLKCYKVSIQIPSHFENCELLGF